MAGAETIVKVQILHIMFIMLIYGTTNLFGSVTGNDIIVNIKGGATCNVHLKTVNNSLEVDSNFASKAMDPVLELTAVMTEVKCAS